MVPNVAIVLEQKQVFEYKKKRKILYFKKVFFDTTKIDKGKISKNFFYGYTKAETFREECYFVRTNLYK